MVISPAIKIVIPAGAKRRAGIQEFRRKTWIPAFAGMTEQAKQVYFFHLKSKA